MHVGKIKYRDQHRAEDRANTQDRGGGAEHMINTLDRGVLRRRDHAEDRANTLDRGGGAEHMTDMLRQPGRLSRPRENSQQKTRETQYRELYAALRDGAQHCNR